MKLTLPNRGRNAKGAPLVHCDMPGCKSRTSVKPCAEIGHRGCFAIPQGWTFEKKNGDEHLLCCPEHSSSPAGPQ